VVGVVTVAVALERGGIMREQPTVFEATASLPASVLQDGTLHQVQSGGIIWIGDINIPVKVGEDAQGPTATVWIGTTVKGEPTGEFALHLGESATQPGVATVTLVSFDRVGASVPAVTLLVKPER